MIAMNLPEKSVRDLLDYTNEFIDNACSQKFIREAEANKSRLKRAMHRADGIPRGVNDDSRLANMVK